MKTIFDYKSYQAFLLDYFQAQRGNQSRLAEFLECRSSFLTQVVDEKVHLSMEQALRAPDFLGLSKLEKLAFTFLVQKEKIGDSQGKIFFEEQIHKLKLQNKTVKERIQIQDGLSEEAKAQYYSSWIYSAVHILCAFSWIATVDDLSSQLKLDRNSVHHCVQFLLENGLLELKNRKLTIGKHQIHLGNESKFIHSHHTNWRLRAVDRFASQNSKGTHFSSLIGISRKDADQVQEIILKAIADINKVVQASGEEAAYVVNMDFFDL